MEFISTLKFIINTHEWGSQMPPRMDGSFEKASMPGLERCYWLCRVARSFLQGRTQLKSIFFLKQQIHGYPNTIFEETILFFRNQQPFLPTYSLFKLTLRANSEILKDAAETKGIWNWDGSSRPTPRPFPAFPVTYRSYSTVGTVQ